MIDTIPDYVIQFRQWFEDHPNIPQVRVAAIAEVSVVRLSQILSKNNKAQFGMRVSTAKRIIDAMNTLAESL